MNLFFDILQLLGGAIIAFGYIPQVRKTLKTGDVSAFSINYLVLTSIGILFMLIYAIYVYTISGTSWALLTTTVITFSLSVLMLWIVVYFKCIKNIKLERYYKYNLVTNEINTNN